LGITRRIADWPEEWLRNRQQRVVVNGSFSSWEFVLSGVLQFSVLGPILFLIHIRDLGKNICSTVLKFVAKFILTVSKDSGSRFCSLLQRLRSLRMLLNNQKVSIHRRHHLNLR